jgi:hypothetical protein
MTARDSRPFGGRRNRVRAFVVAAVCAGVLSSQAFAQDAQPPAQPPAQPTPTAPPAQPAPAAPQAPAQNPFVFGGETAMLTFLIKPDKVADFEKVMAKLHEALANSDKPERKQQAASWKLYKAAEPGPNGNVIYYHIIAPVLKGADYAPSKIIAEVFPSEAQQLFLLYRDAFAGLVRNELTLVRDLSTPAPRTAPPAQ